jgi:hypothetical protein
VTAPAAYRVLVTGSRTWADRDTVHAALASAVYQHLPAVIVHGACPKGADAMASAWARRFAHLDIAEERHPADWGRHGKAAGFRRNAEMVGLGADVCLAFVSPCENGRCRRPRPHGSHGATHTAFLAEQAGIRTHWFPLDVYGGGNPRWPDTTSVARSRNTP